MSSINVIVVLALFALMKTTAQLPPYFCYCYNSLPVDPCWNCGCSNVTNPYCNEDFDTAPLTYGYIVYFRPINSTYTPAYVGCSCPLTPSTASHNAVYFDRPNVLPYNFTHHNYTTCTAFGGNARNLHDHIPEYANNATDCCNFCCGRNDPYPTTTTINGV